MEMNVLPCCWTEGKQRRTQKEEKWQRCSKILNMKHVRVLYLQQRKFKIWRPSDWITQVFHLLIWKQCNLQQKELFHCVSFKVNSNPSGVDCRELQCSNCVRKLCNSWLVSESDRSVSSQTHVEGATDLSLPLFSSLFYKSHYKRCQRITLWYHAWFSLQRLSLSTQKHWTEIIETKYSNKLGAYVQ